MLSALLPPFNRSSWESGRLVEGADEVREGRLAQPSPSERLERSFGEFSSGLEDFGEGAVVVVVSLAAFRGLVVPNVLLKSPLEDLLLLNSLPGLDRAVVQEESRILIGEL